MRKILPLRRFTSRLLFCSVLSSISLLSAATVIDNTSIKPAILLAQNYSSKINLADYLVSEKLDGVRAVWDGKTLQSRSGQIINAPAWFTAQFPAHPLDGELWMGRRKFDLVSAAIRREKPSDEEWKTITYQVFELPEGDGTFSDRISYLNSLIAKMNVPWLQVISQYKVADDRALQMKLKQIVRAGGEGLMLHRADAVWQTGRSDTLLKLKPQLDAEAKVIAHLSGKGKYEGMLGALLVEMPDGKRFRLGGGFSDAQRTNPPEIGSMVTYRYRELTPQGLPRFANFLRLREME